MTAQLLDTSVVIDLGTPAVTAALTGEGAISAVTLAELAAGPHVVADSLEAAHRQARLQRVEATFEVLSFDPAAARSYGLVVAAATRMGRLHRSRRFDLMIAATAHSNGLDLVTRNPDDFRGLDDVLEVVAV